MLQQNGNLFFALAQWRQVECEGVQSIVQILAQTFRCQRFRDVDVGGGQDTHVHLDDAAAAQARELLVLQNVQELGLQDGRHFPDLIKQDRSLVA